MRLRLHFIGPHLSNLQKRRRKSARARQPQGLGEYLARFNQYEFSTQQELASGDHSDTGEMRIHTRLLQIHNVQFPMEVGGVEARCKWALNHF